MSSGSFQLMVLLGREAEGFVPIGGTVSLLFSDVIEELRKIARCHVAYRSDTEVR